MRHIPAMSLCSRFGKAKKLSVMARAYSLSTAVLRVWIPSAGKPRASASGLISLCAVQGGAEADEWVVPF